MLHKAKEGFRASKCIPQVLHGKSLRLTRQIIKQGLGNAGMTLLRRIESFTF